MSDHRPLNSQDAFIRLNQAQHDGPRPHGIGCPECLDQRRCNQCGLTTTKATRCVNGRCRECCRSICRHREA